MVKIINYVILPFFINVNNVGARSVANRGFAAATEAISRTGNQLPSLNCTINLKALRFMVQFNTKNE